MMLREVSRFAAKLLWQFCFRFEFSESDLSKFTGFKVNEWPQSLSQCGFQNSSGFPAFQIRLILGLVRVRACY
ncbi:hypothetical protein EA25_02845 [Vibrio navarrensis]|nr:hypothetical protein EA25_02845 [Vibrio navarrensis]